jgi:hypothetical protein
MQRRLLLWFALLIVGFLAGFVLQYARLQQAQQELSASTKQLGSCQAGEQLSQLRDTATAMFLEAVQKNYGIGCVAQHTEFRLVGPKNGPIRTDPMQGNGSSLGQVAILLLAFL